MKRWKISAILMVPLLCWLAQREVRAGPVPGTTSIPPYTMSGDEYFELKEVTLDILRRFPPDQYHYVAVGRSPTPVISFLEALGLSPTTIPISGLRTESYGSREQRMVVEHFEKYLRPENYKGRKLLVIDFVQSSTSIKRAKAALEALVGSRKENISVSAYALVEKPGINNFPEGVYEGATQHRTAWLRWKLHNSFYDKYAKYGKYSLLDHPVEKSLQVNSHYREIGEALKEHIAGDDSLPNLLRTQPSCDSLFRSFGATVP